MSQSKQALRSRIRSVNSTRKITKAMEMIANAKLLKQRNNMENNREYASKLQDMVNEIAVRNPHIENDYMKTNDSKKTLTIVFGSDLGLCGSYNQNVVKALKDEGCYDDLMYLVGSSLHHQLKEEGFHLLNETPISSDNLEFQGLKDLVDVATKMYLEGEISCFRILYTRFVNTMSFVPTFKQILPFTFESVDEKQPQSEMVETLFEPDAQTILDTLIPMMIADVIYSSWIETTTAEQGSRRMAMKTATDNADELSDKLKLEYNKARQAAITQEITEIVGGSTAV